MQCCPSMVDTTLYKLFSSWKMSVSHGSTLHRWSPCAMLVQIDPSNTVDYFLCQVVCGVWANIAQAKTLFSVVQFAPDNIVLEKILFNVVLILLGQHCTSKNFVQCCSRDSRQHCTGKNPVQYCLKYSWDSIAQVKTLCNVVQEAPDNIAHEKILLNNVVILLGQHYTGKNPVQSCPRSNLVQCHLNNITFRRLFWTG